MIDHYFYDGAMRRYLLQFCHIFVGLQVQTGAGECGDSEFMTVPIQVGSRDRVVAALNANNNQNNPYPVPSMSATITGLSLPSVRHGTGTVDKKVYLPRGGIFPDDLKTVTRIMPIQYLMSVDLSIIASNTLQMHQILEQILMLFDPTLQIQTNDSAFDWTKLTQVQLTGISNEENYPAGADRRSIIWTLSFEIPIYISAPLDIRDDVVKKLIIKLGDLDGMQLGEIDENGDVIPFKVGSEWAEIRIDGSE